MALICKSYQWITSSVIKNHFSKINNTRIACLPYIIPSTNIRGCIIPSPFLFSACILFYALWLAKSCAPLSFMCVHTKSSISLSNLYKIIKERLPQRFSLYGAQSNPHIMYTTLEYNLVIQPCYMYVQV